MKASAKQYAQSLYDAVSGKNQSEVAAVLGNFLKILVNQNDLKKADKAIVEFLNIWNRENGLVEANVTSAREIDKDAAKEIREYVKAMSGAREVELKRAIDEKLLAGFVLTFNDLVLDGSLKTKIGELKDEMTK